MEQKSKTLRPNIPTLRWGVAALVIAALLVFAGAALAQETQPTAETPAETAAKPAAGLVVIHLEADSPAAAAGVARGDIILAVDGDDVNTLPELMHVIATHDAGDVVVLTAMHGGEERSLSVTLGDNNGRPELGLVAVGDLAVGKKMQTRGQQNWNMPGDMFRRGGRGQGQMPGMPFGRDGQGMRWMKVMSAEGALVMDVMDESAAAAAGIQAGDIITAVNDVTVATSDDLISLLADHKPGDEVTVTYSRDDATANTEVTLGAHPDDETKAYLGVQLAPTGPMRMQMENGATRIMPGQGMMPGAMTSGVMVAAVTEEGPAATAGLEEGDWITAVNGDAIDTPQALVDAVNAAKPGDEMVLTVQGADDEEASEVTVTLGENDEGGALLGVQIGGVMRVQNGTNGMNFDFHQFRGPQGMPAMPFHRHQQDGNRFEFQMPGPDDGEAAPVTPDARYQQQPGYATQGA
ncbi:MAG: PDZ domain-containing protein [Caldilineaceae bacterium]|nr:PDZ domain-containing protein [Caldilineaceae bacterium]